HEQVPLVKHPLLARIDNRDLATRPIPLPQFGWRDAPGHAVLLAESGSGVAASQTWDCTNCRHSGARAWPASPEPRNTRPIPVGPKVGVHGFRAWSFGPPRNDYEGTGLIEVIIRACDRAIPI